MTLDEDVAAALQSLARDRGVSFKEALNASVRAGLSGAASAPTDYRVPARPLGLRPDVDLDKALQLAGALEDEEIVRRLELRK